MRGIQVGIYGVLLVLYVMGTVLSLTDGTARDGFYAYNRGLFLIALAGLCSVVATAALLAIALGGAIAVFCLFDYVWDGQLELLNQPWPYNEHDWIGLGSPGFLALMVWGCTAHSFITQGVVRSFQSLFSRETPVVSAEREAVTEAQRFKQQLQLMEPTEEVSRALAATEDLTRLLQKRDEAVHATEIMDKVQLLREDVEEEIQARRLAEQELAANSNDSIS